MTRYDATHAYIIHTRPYRESSCIVDAYTKAHGRVSLIAKGFKKTAKRALLQQFNKLEIAFQGRSELMTLTQIESVAHNAPMTGSTLMCALYINELMYRLLHKHESNPELFFDYDAAIQSLHNGDEANRTLRVFEAQLLTHLGYGLDFSLIEENLYYAFSIETGFRAIHSKQEGISGKDLLNLSNQDFSSDETLKSAKRLMRGIFNELLDQRKIMSRELFV